MSDLDNSLRDKHFTSSKIYRLCGSLKDGSPSKAFYSYVEDIKYEIYMGRSIEVNSNTKTLKWGSIGEIVLFNLLGLEYQMEHKATIKHKTISNYSGTPDLKTELKVGEIKCPYPKQFAKATLCLLKKDIELVKEELPVYYWQVLSNAILLDLDIVEIIVYMPYLDELIEIIQQIEDTNFLERNELNPNDYYFMRQDDINTLPFLPNDSKMSNINRFEFEVPKQDKEFLLERIKLAVSLLNE